MLVLQTTVLHLQLDAPLEAHLPRVTPEQSLAASMSESYARKLREFMEERAQERLQICVAMTRSGASARTSSTKTCQLSVK